MRTTETEALAPALALAPHQCLTLALAARGFFPTEIAAMRRVGVASVVEDLHAAVERLGAATVRGAIAEAARRGLLA